MMIKTDNQPSVHPVNRVDSVAAIKSIATASQDDVERAINRTINQVIELVKGDHYSAKVIAQRNKNTFDIEVAGFKLGLQLDDKASNQLTKFLQTGQKLVLTYVGGHSPPKFQLPPLTAADLASNTQEGATLSLSNAANIIKQSFQSANTQLNPSSSQITSKEVITNQPKNTKLTAHSLKNILVNSGLFYESHLADFVDGSYTLQALKQEPQNLLSPNLGIQTQPQSLLPQQLALLETQHFSWQGQVWPNQTMQWHLWKNTPQDSDERQPDTTQSKQDAAQKISSQLSLNLPNLGKVSVRLEYQDEKMRVNILANDSQTKVLLKDSSRYLVTTMQDHGQHLERLLVS